MEWSTGSSIHCRCDESGLDNSPRFDRGSRLAAIDFNSFLVNECEILGQFALQLGREQECEAWRKRSARLGKLIQERLWDDSIGFYVDYDVPRNERSPILASVGFLPLLCGIPSPAQAERLAQHLHNPATFGTPFPIPSVAACHSYHYQKDMWRGPTWVNLNWLVAHGFERSGMPEAARWIRQRTVEEIEHWFQEAGTFFEFYDDRQEVSPPELKRKGQCAPEVSVFHQVFFDYGWTAALYVDLVASGLDSLEG